MGVQSALNPDCMDVFVTLQHLPHPKTSLQDVFGTKIIEEHRQSLSAKNTKKTIPIPTSVQHAENTIIMVQCDECQMWRLVYCKYSQFRHLIVPYLKF